MQATKYFLTFNPSAVRVYRGGGPGGKEGGNCTGGKSGIPKVAVPKGQK